MNNDPSSKFAIVLSFIAIFFGIVAIITTRPYNWHIDFVGVAFATVCSLVTLFAAWNIYSAIDVDKKIKKFDDNLTSFKSDVQENNDSIIQDIHFSMVEAFTGLSRFFASKATLKDSVENMVVWYIICELTCVVHYSIVEDFDGCESRITNITNTLKSSINVQKEDKDRVHSLIGMIRHADRISNYNNLLSSIENLRQR